MSERNYLFDQQRDKLVTHMEDHPLFATKQIDKLGVCGVDTYRKMWKDLENIFNKIGPMKQTWQEWEEIWMKLRKSSKEQMHNFLFASKQTGNHDAEPPAELVQRVCSIFGFYGLGCSLIPELGVYTTDIHEDESHSFFKLYEDRGFCVKKGKKEKVRKLRATHMFISNTAKKGAKSYGSKSAPSTFKLSIGNVRYIAAFIEGRGKRGVLEEHDWIELSCNDEMPAGASGAVLQVLWDREVAKAKLRLEGNKHKPLDVTVLKAAGQLEKKRLVTNVEENQVAPKAEAKPLVSSKFSEVVKSDSKPKATSTPKPKDEVISLLSDEEDFKEDKFDSDDSFDKKYPIFNVGSAIEKGSLKNDKLTPGTSNEGNPSAFKRSHIGSTNASKKSKLTLFDAQCIGIEKLSEGNDLTSYWARKFVDSFESHTTELRRLNQNVSSLVEENKGIRENTKDLVDQITNAYLSNRIKKMKQVAVQQESLQDSVDIAVPQSSHVPESTDADDVDNVDANIKEEPVETSNDQGQVSEREVDSADD